MKPLKSVILIIFACSLFVTMPVYAQEYSTDLLFQIEPETTPLVVNVSVPLNISATMKLDGGIEVNGSAVIQNLETDYSITLDGISVTGYDGWEIKDFNTDFSTYQVNSKALGIKIGDFATPDGGTIEIAPGTVNIQPGQSLDMPVMISMPSQNSESGLLEPKAVAKISYLISPVDTVQRSLEESSTSTESGACESVEDPTEGVKSQVESIQESQLASEPLEG